MSKCRKVKVVHLIVITHHTCDILFAFFQKNFFDDSTDLCRSRRVVLTPLLARWYAVLAPTTPPPTTTTSGIAAAVEIR